MRLRTLFILWLLGGSPVWAGAVVVIDFDQANPPYMYVQDGQLRGIFPELCRRVFMRLRVPVELRPRPWARALELNTGSAGLCGLYKTEDRAKRLDFSDYLMEDTILVYSLKSKPIVPRRVWDLWGRRIGVMRGWSYGDEFDHYRSESMFQISEVSTDEQNFQMLASGRIDCFLAIPTSVASLTPRYPAIQPSQIPIAINTTHLAFSKELHARDLLARFNAEVHAMRDSGEFQRLITYEISFWVNEVGAVRPK